MEKTAVLSGCRTYRYELRRVWEPSLPLVACIGLNPSKADEATDDPTIRRCVGFAQRWGMGGLIMVNLFGYRSTDPTTMFRTLANVGDQNDRHVCKAVSEAALSVAMWGALPRDAESRQRKILDSLQDVTLKCFGTTKGGFPKHPVRLSYETPLEVFWNL